MWGLELPYRRYSVPETIMRKVRLRQSSSSSSDSSTRRVTRRPMARARHAGRNRYCMNTSTKGVQTSPYSNHCTEVQAENQCLLHNRHRGQPRRATSVPNLSSDAEGRIDQRPSSARDKLLERYTQPTCKGPPIMISPGGTPSPSQASNYSSALQRCDVYSNTWSYTTSSEYTLGQTVSDRTTSTQDSTLSLQSSTPESSTSNSFSSAERAAQKIFLENSIFSPAGNFIAVHTESLLIQPIEIIERRENWNFGFSDSPESDPLAALSSCHRSIAINTEPPEMIGASMVDKSTCAYGVFNDKSAQVRDSDIENELMIDKSTYIEMLNGLLRNGNGEEDRKEASDIQATEEPLSVDIGINTDQCTALLDEKDEENQFSGYHHTTPLSRRAVFKIPNIKIFKESTTESQQTDDRSNAVEEAKIYVTKSTSVEENLFRNIEDDQQICKYCSKEELTEKDNIFNKGIKQHWKTKSERIDVGGPFERKLCADVACTGCNYKDYPEVDGVIARYSAIPRSNSMLVNTSSIDYSSDSDLSLTDSLEDCNEHRAENYDRPNTRHDNRLVRGEVSLEQEQTSKRYPKSNKAYAYFLSITGEQDMVRQCPLPDWLKVRLQRREEEIKKLFQIRLNKHQTIVYRRRKKTMKRIKENEDSNSAGKEDTLQKVQKRCVQDAEDAVKDNKYIETAHTEDMPSTSAANNINGQVRKEVLQVNSNSNPIEAKTTIEETKNGRIDLQQNTNKDNNYLHISEIIKIEMLNSLNTVITKEKQINLNKNLFTREQNNFHTSDCIKNENSLNAQKIIMKTNIGNLQMDNNSLPELENECQISSKKKDEDTVKIKDTNEPESKIKEKAIIKKKQNESYSLKQFKPLFQSKADDQTVAEILLSAMENNASLKNDKEFQTKEREASRDEHLCLSNPLRTEDGHKAATIDTKLKYNNVALFSEPNVKIERSCNTITPYLSAMVQTKESFLKEKSFSFAEGEEGEIEELKDTKSTTLIKAESTHSIPMISSLVQTNETFLKNDKSFIESESLVLIRDQGTDIFQESSDGKNENEYVDKPLLSNLENEQVSVFVQTEQNVATINEVKPLIIHSKNEEFKGNIKNDDHDGKTYTSNKKLSTNSNKSRRHGMDLHKQNCKYYSGGSHEHKASQVLELNIQPCTCHMCTLNKKVGSRNDKFCEGYHSALQSSSGIRRKLQSRNSPSEDKEEKKTFQRYSNNKRSNITNKFQRRFEVIPEEKNSSTESVGEVQVTPLKLTADKKKLNTYETNNFEKARLDQDEYEEVHTSEIKDNRGKVTKELRSSLSVLKERENVMYSSEVKSTQTNGSKKSNVVFGRFKAIKNDARTNNEGKMLGEGVEVMQQYKGRAALAAAPVDGQEQLLTLSKGWINFYLLKDNQEFSDSNNDEVQQFRSESLVQRAVSPIRILKGTEFKEEQVEEFTVEIRATPEPIQPSDKSLLLPNLHQDILRKQNLGEKIVPIEEKSKKCHPLPVVNGRRSSRHEIRMKRESVTAFEQIPKPEPLLRLAEEFASGFEKGHSTKAVEVALSEHSVSSISSTLILSEESPSPKHERKSRHRQRGGQIIQQQSDRNGSSWTVTVAGTSGNNSNVHPDVEMKLTFGNKQTGINNKELCDENEKRLVKFNAKKSSRTSSSKRKGRMMEEFAHTSRDEQQRSIQYMPGVMLQNTQNSKFEGTVTHKDLGGYLDHENTSQLSRRSKGSIEGSSDATSLCSDLQVTGLAITPESKPYVPTQSERDLVRRQRYKFTR